MGRSPCCSKVGLNRGAWTALEDRILTDYIKVHGEGKWRNLPTNAGLKRCGKSCRLRWLNYLRADIKRGNITHDEEDLIIRLHKLLGNRWSLIAGRLPGRTDNEIKNYWNTNLGKKVQGHPTSTSARNKQHSNQKSKGKKNPIRERPTEPPPSPKLESQVIRTKAVRCTNVFLTPEPHNNVQVEHLNTHDATTVGASFDEPASSTAGANKENSRNCMVDLNVGELWLSDLLNADFSQLCEFDHLPLLGDYSKDKDLSTMSSEQPPFFLDEMMDGWTGTHCAEPGMASDLPSLSRCLDPEEYWQGK